MKKIYLSYDVVGEEIIDAFVRNNNQAAIRDFTYAFQRQGKDSTHVKLFEVSFDDKCQGNLEGFPVYELWDSEEFEEVQKSEN